MIENKNAPVDVGGESSDKNYNIDSNSIISPNTKYKLHVDTVGYDKKPPNNIFGTIRNRLQVATCASLYTIKEVVDAACQGKSLCFGVMIGGTKSSNWTQQQIFAVDIDNKNQDFPQINYGDVLKICKRYNLKPSFIYHSFSSCKEKFKARVGFVCNKPITDTNKRRFIINTLMSLFNQCDTSCRDATRIFYGTNKECVYIDEYAYFTFEDIIAINGELSKIIKIKNVASEPELKTLVENFDSETFFKDYCREIETETEEYIMFRRCPICGHNNDFVYYKNSKKFVCFGVNGDKKGDIIDFIQIVEHLTLGNAINKFKYDILKLPKPNFVVESTPLNKIQALTKGISNVKNAKKYDWIVEGWFARQHTSIIFGEPGCGKTWLLIYISLVLTVGGKLWQDLEVKQAKVLFFEGDTPVSTLNERISKLNKPLNDDYFKYVSRYDADENDINLSLFTEDGRNNFESFIKNFIPDLIVIDTLISFIDDEKDAERIKLTIDFLKLIAVKYNCHVVIVHHSRKRDRGEIRNKLDQSDVIGSSVITRLASIVIGVDKYVEK